MVRLYSSLSTTMTLAIANRYASALAEVVTQAESPVTVETTLGQLCDFQDLLKNSGELRNVLDSPAVTPANKRRLTGHLAKRLELSVTVRNFLYVVIDHRRMTLLGEMIDALQGWIDERAGVTRITITAARPMAEDQQDVLVAKFSCLTGCKVVPKFVAAPELVGGVTVRSGSTIFDGSLRSQLNNLARTLSGEA